MFFQDRYSSFYLIAVNCPDEQRKKRLRSLGLHDDDIKSIDEQEYQEKDVADSDAYSIQDISSCLQRADIYINNPDGKYNVDKFSFLSNQIIKFIMLMRRPGLVTPNAIERCMQLAYSAKLNSGCISRQVGAAVTDSNFSIRAIGWNDVPHGQVPCNLRNRFSLVNGIDSKAYSDFEKNNIEFINYINLGSEKYINVPKNRNVSYCFKSEFNRLKNEKIRFIQELFMLRKMLSYRYQNMEGLVFLAVIFLLPLAHVNYVQKKHINLVFLEFITLIPTR